MPKLTNPNAYPLEVLADLSDKYAERERSIMRELKEKAEAELAAFQMKRDDEMMNARASGVSITGLSEAMGVSRSWVHQRIKHLELIGWYTAIQPKAAHAGDKYFTLLTTSDGRPAGFVFAPYKAEAFGDYKVGPNDWFKCIGLYWANKELAWQDWGGRADIGIARLEGMLTKVPYLKELLNDWASSHEDIPKDFETAKEIYAIARKEISRQEK